MIQGNLCSTGYRYDLPETCTDVVPSLSRYRDKYMCGDTSPPYYKECEYRGQYRDCVQFNDSAALLEMTFDVCCGDVCCQNAIDDAQEDAEVSIGELDVEDPEFDEKVRNLRQEVLDEKTMHELCYECRSYESESQQREAAFASQRRTMAAREMPRARVRLPFGSSFTGL